MRARLLLVLALALVGCGDRHDPAPTVGLVAVVRGATTLSRGDHSDAVEHTARVESDATVATGDDGRAALTLDSGAWILFDRATRGTAALGALTLAQGRVWVDASSADETAIVTPHGRFASEGASFAVEIAEGETRVYCGAGEVTFTTPNGEGRVAQGETVRAGASGAPAVAPEAMWEDWTGGLVDPAAGRLRVVERVGVLSGRAPYEIGRARTPLPIRGHEVNVEIRGDLAVTEVVQTFFNARSEVLEGEWAMRLPEGAIVAGFAVDDGNGFVDAVVATVAINSSYQLAWQRRDMPGSKLTWDGPERLRARVHPVPPGGTVRVRVRYTEWLDRRGERRTYVYPMRPEGAAPLLGEFVLTVDARGAGASAMRAGMGAADEGGRVVLRRSDFRPRADFYLDLEDGATAHEDDVAIAYRVGGVGDRPVAEGEDDYVLFDVPTAALAGDDVPEGDATPALVLLLDVSGATDSEDLEIARGVVEATLRQLAPTDRVAIRVSDVHARAPEGAPEGLVPATPENREAILASLARIDLGGATDLGASLRDAAALVSGEPRGSVLYLGDAMPTTGALDATALRAVLAGLDAPPRFFGLAIGDGANIDLLRALFGDQARAVRDREGAARAVMDVLADAARATLRGVTFELGEGIERVYPRGPLTVRHGAHLRLVGRRVDELPTTITIRGLADGTPFERSLRVQLGSIDDEGDVRRRWASARLRELLDQDAGREALVDLGVRFGLVTPWTALGIGVTQNSLLALIEGFDHDPLGVAWGLGGGAPTVPITGLTSDELGWRRRLARPEPAQETSAPEATWASRVSATPPPAEREAGDGGLGRAAVDRALAVGERGPRQCYERRALVRPDLSGDVGVRVQVGGSGEVSQVQITRSGLGDRDVEQCVLTEVRGLRFPAHGGTEITVEHTFVFRVPERELGTRRQCSDASQQALEIRRALWRERLAVNAGVVGALSVWREARAQCELGNWRARRTLLDMMLGHVGGVRQEVELYRALASDAATASYLRRAILRHVRTVDDVYAVRWGLGLDVGVDWTVFSRLWWQNADPRARLALVRRWLEVAPEEMDLRLRLLALLEQTGALPEARRVARELRADPLADARVRTAVGEFWLRQENELEARRVFSEIVEHAPLDPWARRRLGDLYRAHAWADDAYREYTTLARLRPGEGDVLLLLARAAADAHRTDEALRLEQRLAEATEPGFDEGAAAHARLWTMVRLAHLERAATDDEMRRAIRRRWREAGVLRDPPDVFVALTWSHPDDYPRLAVHWPGTDDPNAFEDATLGGYPHGIHAIRIAEREPGEYVFEIRRDERDAIRDTTAELVILTRPGTPEQHIVVQPITLTRERRVLRYRLAESGDLVEVSGPPAATPAG